jgi:hypothetical protein
LTDFDVGLGQAAGTDRAVQVALATDRRQSGVLLDRRRQVGVGDQHPPPLRRQHPGSHRGALAAVLRQAQDAAATAGQGTFRDRGRLVRRPVVDDQDLERRGGRLEVRRDRRDRPRQDRLLAVGGDDDRYVRTDGHPVEDPRRAGRRPGSVPLRNR